MSKVAFAKAVGSSERAIRRYLNGERSAPLDVLAAWERVCGLPEGSLAKLGAGTRRVIERAGVSGVVDRRFVGRTGERERLTLALRRSASGRQLVLVTGEAGIGKTRLVEELAAEGEAWGARVLRGGCDEHLRWAFQPFDTALRPLIGELADLLPASEPGLDASTTNDYVRGRLFARLTATLAAEAERSPLLVILEDLHWAAEPALLLLRHLVLDRPEVPMLLVGTYNDRELGPHHPLLAHLPDLRRQAGVERLLLRGLAESEVGELLDHSAPSDAHRELAARLFEESAGNPLFVWELIELLSEASVLTPSGGGYTITGAPAELRLPDGIRDVIGRRLARRTEITQQLLSDAAVLGADFDLAGLLALSEPAVDEAQALAALEEASQAGLVVETGPGRFRFAHNVIRRTLYEQLTDTRQAVVHRKVAQALELQQAPAASIAHHWLQGAPVAGPSPAVRWLVAAAEQARDQAVWEEAAGHAHRALELLDQLQADPVTRCRLLLVLAQCPMPITTGVEQVRALTREAADLAREAGEGLLFARAAELFGNYVYTGIGDSEPVVSVRKLWNRSPTLIPAIRSFARPGLACSPSSPSRRSGRGGVVPASER